MMLSLCGAQVQIAYDGERALEMSEAFRPEVVFLDLGMPRMDGYEVARRLRSALGRPNATIVAADGLGPGPRTGSRSRTAGFDHHLVKPVAVETLRDILRDVLPEGVIAAHRTKLH